MTIAEILGKLTPYEAMEDLLTSDVFGTFSYLPQNEGLLPFLSEARSLSGEKFDFLNSEVLNVEYIFWPKTTKLKREGDLLLLLELADGNTVAIMVEAKFSSGKHNKERSSETEGNLFNQHIDGDQLGELYSELINNNLYLINEEARLFKCSNKRYLLYVTSHHAIPRQDLDETLGALRKRPVFHDRLLEQDIFWVSWRSAYSALNRRFNARKTLGNIRLMADLIKLLERKSLIPYDGYLIPKFEIKPQNQYYWLGIPKIYFSSVLTKSREIKTRSSYYWQFDS